MAPDTTLDGLQPGERSVSSVARLTELLGSVRQAGKVIGLVPTMGGLHDGHRALLGAARQRCEFVVCSIFVNRIQFGKAADFVAYPRDAPTDVANALQAGADICFAPEEVEMYPNGPPQFAVDPGSLGETLEGVFRPGHFRGVATVVSKLFALVYPNEAFFGEKDYQQLVIVRQLVEDLSFPIHVVACPTVRDASGLALSSRNLRLASGEREAATVLYRALCVGRDVADGSTATPADVEEAMTEVVATERGVKLDYAVVRSSDRLAPLRVLGGSMRLLIAASVGAVRLIDNIEVDR